jgi:hypothetical protein
MKTETKILKRLNIRKLSYRDLHPSKAQQKDWAHLTAMHQRIKAEVLTLQELNKPYPNMAAVFSQLLQTMEPYIIRK